MAKRNGLSKAETEIARILGELGSASVREVFETISQRKKIDFSTVQTYLRRLEAKGYARTRLRDRVRIYALKVKPATLVRETVDDLLDRLFAGRAMPLVKHLVDDGKVSVDELKELREHLESLERRHDSQEANDD